jgi:malonyl CoA-acyl carrier protein transacylase
MPEALLSFREFLRSRAGQTVWRYIPSTIPAHSPLLSYAFRSSPLDAQRIGLRLRKEDMKMPVWSTDGGADLSSSENVLVDAMRGYLTRPGTWWDQIRPVLTPGCISHVLDFGPGAGTASLTQSHLAGSAIQVLRCSATLGRRRLLQEVAPLLS